MSHHRTYRSVRYVPADPLRGDPCDSRDPRRPMNPLAGIWATHRTTYGYREASPHGDGVLFVLEWNCSARSQQTANYSLHTANSTAATYSTFFILHSALELHPKNKSEEIRVIHGNNYNPSRYVSPVQTTRSAREHFSSCDICRDMR